MVVFSRFLTGRDELKVLANTVKRVDISTLLLSIERISFGITAEADPY